MDAFWRAMFSDFSRLRRFWQKPMLSPGFPLARTTAQGVPIASIEDTRANKSSWVSSAGCKRREERDDNAAGMSLFVREEKKKKHLRSLHYDERGESSPSHRKQSDKTIKTKAEAEKRGQTLMFSLSFWHFLWFSLHPVSLPSVVVPILLLLLESKLIARHLMKGFLPVAAEWSFFFLPRSGKRRGVAWPRFPYTFFFFLDAANGATGRLLSLLSPFFFLSFFFLVQFNIISSNAVASLVVLVPLAVAPSICGTARPPVPSTKTSKFICKWFDSTVADGHYRLSSQAHYARIDYCCCCSCRRRRGCYSGRIAPREKALGLVRLLHQIQNWPIWNIFFSFYKTKEKLPLDFSGLFCDLACCVWCVFSLSFQSELFVRWEGRLRLQGGMSRRGERERERDRTEFV